jgi:hypothetical protein
VAIRLFRLIQDPVSGVRSDGVRRVEILRRHGGGISGFEGSRPFVGTDESVVVIERSRPFVGKPPQGDGLG